MPATSRSETGIVLLPLEDWAELFEACHSMSKSRHEKLVMLHAHDLLHIIVKLKMYSNRYQS